MKIKEQTMKELESLGHAELITVYETIISLKARHREREIREGEPGYLRVRKALKQCKGSLSEDIKLLRKVLYFKTT